MSVSFKGTAFPFRFNGSGGVSTSTTSYGDIAHILEGIAQLLTTYPVERVMELEQGSYLLDIMFTNGEDADISEAVYNAKVAIEQFEQRIEVVNVETEFIRDDATVTLNMLLRDKSSDVVTDVTFNFTDGGGARWMIN